MYYSIIKMNILRTCRSSGGPAFEIAQQRAADGNSTPFVAWKSYQAYISMTILFWSLDTLPYAFAFGGLGFLVY